MKNLLSLFVCLFGLLVMGATLQASPARQDLTIIYSNDVREEIEPCG